MIALAMVAGSLLVGAPEASAATLPAGFTQTTYATGLGKVTAMSFAPDGRLFVAAQDGVVRVVKNGVTLATPFLTLPTAASGETGLTGITLDPDFATNHFVYVYYTVQGTPMHNRVSRFVADGDVALTSGGSAVETPLLDLDPLTTTSHVSGALRFGVDGMLYVSVGDNLTSASSQSLGTTFGKILRIGKDGSIPADNPYADTATGANRAIWATGLRNPFTFAVQPVTGRTFVNDVGQDTWEEIDELVKGGNYGWPTTEGPTTDPAFVGPTYSYPHVGDGVTGCAITGGTFYDPTTATFPSDYVGDYFFADYCGGWIKSYDPTTNTVSDFASGVAAQPIDLQVGPDGDLYYLSRGESSVTRISHPVVPQTVSLTLGTTTPSGLPLTLDGQSHATPYVLDSAVGVSHTLGVVSPQTVDGKTYRFVSWSDGGAATHAITTPSSSTTYTATFAEVPAAPTTVALTPAADSYANAASPTTRFGSSSLLYARGGATPAVTYMRFKLPGAPAGRTLTKAVLRLRTATRATAGSTVAQKVTLADDTWSESGLTWNNRPVTRQSLGTLAAGTGVDKSYTVSLSSVDVASRLGTTVSLAVVGGGGDDLWFDSRSIATSSFRPQLTLTFG